MNKVKIHSRKDSTWVNAAGDIVPVKFVPKSDLQKEVYAGQIHKAALNAEAVLKSLYELMDRACKEISAMVREEYQFAKGKAKKATEGFTWYNFDKSLRIEAEVNDIMKWDDALMTEALKLLNKYIGSTLGESNELIKGLINDVFTSRKGTIDSRKVFQLLKYESKIKNASFQKACELIKQAQGIDRTKLYMRVWEKDAKGEYRNVILNFSNL